MYAYNIKYYHTSYGWIMSRAVHIYLYRGNRVLGRKSLQKRAEPVEKLGGGVQSLDDPL